MEEKEVIKMKPCKLCGEMPKIVKYNKGICYSYHVVHNHADNDCGHYMTVYANTEELAIKEWNRLNEEEV